ncbi:MAG: neutral/alkaline non-lysosomal ceramidase N-terminal domain-containing protein [Prolixibacteraceae bacterium]|nr:neutral/alkaline non-lysosomal ceramidase N-terminal domain-containing protein [Prolixibacteraceae bacterium]
MLKSIIYRILAFIFLFANGFYILPAKSEGWKAGIARKNITPEEAVWMAGYGGRDHPAEGTLVDLWAKALALRDENGNKAVLITTDLESFPKSVSDNIRNRLVKELDLSKDRIILNSSHTHSGPVLDGMFNIYTNDSQQLERISNYTKSLENDIFSLVKEALSKMAPVDLYVQNGVTRFQVNRRNNVERNIDALTELNGPNDYAVPVIKVVDKREKIIAVAFGYSCHATTLSGYLWSGDYPGFAQMELEKLYPGTTALFFQGAGADQNPLPRRTVALAKQYGRELAYAVDRVLNEEMKKLSPQLSTAYSEVDLKFAGHPDKEELISFAERTSGYQRQWAESLINKMEKGEPQADSYPYPVQVWKLGEQPVIILGGELVVDYAIKLKQIFGQDTFVLGYSNDVMAYIPSERILEEGGYEGASSQIAFGLPAPWAVGIETVIISKVLELAEQAGITMPESKLIDN